MQVLDFTYPPGSYPHIPISAWETKATLNMKDLPSSLSICSSLFVKSWVAGAGSYITFFSLLNQDDGKWWAWFGVKAVPTGTVLYATIGWGDEPTSDDPVRFQIETLPIFFPQSWIRACITFDTAAGMMRIVADGKVVEDASYPKLRNFENKLPRNSTFMVGKGTGINSMFSDFNIFSELLSLERMVAITTPGAKECGSRGDLLNWEEAEWTLSDKWANGEWADWVLGANASKLVELDWIRGPCWRPSRIKSYFIKNQNDQSFCMKHCQKIGYGRSPSLVTQEDFSWLVQEVAHLKESLPSFLYFWLSATEGNSG